MDHKDGVGHGMLDSDSRRSVLFLFFLSLVIRLILVLAFSSRMVGDWMDSVRYLSVARNINVGRGFSEYYGIPTAFVPPIYPYFLAGMYRIFGPHPFAVQLFQVLLGAMVCLAIYRMASILFGHRAGILAMAVSALYPELLVMTGYLYTETLYMALSSWSFVFMLEGMSAKGRWRDWIMGGILFGLGLLTRHVLLFFPIFLGVLFLVFRKTRMHFKKLLAFAFIAYALLVPWTIRNYSVFHAFVPVATGGGGEFWVGSYVPYEGKFHYLETREQIRQLTRGAKNEVEKDRMLVAAGLKNIVKHPYRYVLISMKKWFRFFFQIYENMPTGKPRITNTLIWIGLALCYYPILVLSCLGVYWNREKWTFLLPVYGILVYSSLLSAVVHAVPRYRIPLMPFFILLASDGFTRLVALATKGRK